MIPLPPLDGEHEQTPVPSPAFIEGMDDVVFVQLSNRHGYHAHAVQSDGALWSLQPGAVATPAGTAIHQVNDHWGQLITLNRMGELEDDQGMRIGDPGLKYREMVKHSTAVYAIDETGELHLLLPRESGAGTKLVDLERIPEFDVPIQSLSLGNSHALALLKDGSLISWGGNPGNVVSEQPELREIRDIVGVSNSSFAIFGQGRVTGWGAGLNPRTKNPVLKRFLERLANIKDAEELFTFGEPPTFAIRHTGNRWSVLIFQNQGGENSWRFEDEIAAQLEGCHFVTINENAIIGIFAE
ncbi:MAG: RCC1 domain-containing protein [Verrucomicrobiota bacterium]